MCDHSLHFTCVTTFHLSTWGNRQPRVFPRPVLVLTKGHVPLLTLLHQFNPCALSFSGQEPPGRVGGPLWLIFGEANLNLLVRI